MRDPTQTGNDRSEALEELTDTEMIEAFKEALEHGAFETIPDYEIID